MNCPSPRSVNKPWLWLRTIDFSYPPLASIRFSKGSIQCQQVEKPIRWPVDMGCPGMKEHFRYRKRSFQTKARIMWPAQESRRIGTFWIDHGNDRTGNFFGRLSLVKRDRMNAGTSRFGIVLRDFLGQYKAIACLVKVNAVLLPVFLPLRTLSTSWPHHAAACAHCKKRRLWSVLLRFLWRPSDILHHT